MLTKRILLRYILSIAFALLALNACVKLAAYSIVRRKLTFDRGVLDLSLVTEDTGEVLLELDSWTRYKLFSPLEWRPLFPGGGVVHLGPQREPFTVAMMHQLRCLDVVRDQLSRLKVDRDEEPTHHCLNYLRQALQCRGDTQLDSYQYPHKVNPVHPHLIRRCKDWRVVYDRVAEYQQSDSSP